MQITPGQAEALIEATHGQIFSVRFIKRTDGEPLQLTARTGVTKYLTGGGRAYEPSDYYIVDPFVFDMQTGHRTPTTDKRRKAGYKSIPKDGIISITFRGTVYDVVQP